MTTGPQLFRININGEVRESKRVEEVDFARLGFQERRDIQEWIAADPGILGEDLLIVGKEFGGFDRTNERLDLLAVDVDGRMVVIELKRDDSGTNAHWQAIKYASYLRDASQEAIVGMLARHEDVSQDEAIQKLLQHLGADDLNALNNDQRIILASHRFAPEVTSAALWLNEQAARDDLITCIQLTPHYDAGSGLLYIQVNTLIPLQGAEDLSIGISEGQDSGIRSSDGIGDALRRSFARSRSDERTPFLRRVGDIVLQDIPEPVRPDKRSRWAGQGGDHRYYHLWYSRPPWGNWTTSYRVDLYEGETPKWRAHVHFATGTSELMDKIQDLKLLTSAYLDGDALNESFYNEIAAQLRTMIEEITPAVDDFENERNEEST